MTNFTVDTNILIYSIDPTDAAKHRIARTIMARVYSSTAFLPLQCLSEFYAVCVRKKLLARVSQISEVVSRAIESSEVIPYSPEDLLAAIQLHQQHHLQFFDALLISTAKRSGCQTLFTEDMQNGRALEGITLINPFHLTPEELDRLLA